MSKLFDGTYHIADAYIVDKATGERKPFPTAKTFTVPVANEAEKRYTAPPEVTQTFSVEWEGDLSGWFDLFTEPKHEGTYFLSDDGRVYAYVSFNVNGETYPARWYFVDVIDRGVWRYALRSGLQLEDAVRELNAWHRKQP